MATLDRPDQGRRDVLRKALGIATLAPAIWLVGRQLPMDAWRADLQTSTGERTRQTLADGSTLQLNTASAVNVDMAQRRVTLVRGEIALNVPGNVALTVQSVYGQVWVSRSEVCLRLDDEGCQVAVVSGGVQLQLLQGPVITLGAGQQVRLQRSGTGLVTGFDGSLPGWRQGVLSAQNQPLGDFLRELSRYRTGLLRWDPALEALRVTGSFRLDNTDRILSLLAASLPLEVHSRTRYWVTLQRPGRAQQKNA